MVSGPLLSVTLIILAVVIGYEGITAMITTWPTCARVCSQTNVATTA